MEKYKDYDILISLHTFIFAFLSMGLVVICFKLVHPKTQEKSKTCQHFFQSMQVLSILWLFYMYMFESVELSFIAELSGY